LAFARLARLRKRHYTFARRHEAFASRGGGSAAMQFQCIDLPSQFDFDLK
jgi:hypothetical protein